MKRAPRTRSKPAPKKKLSAISFRVGEFPHYQRGNNWYLGMGLLMLALLVLFIEQGEYLLSAVVLALALAIFQLSRAKSPTHDFRISTRGIEWAGSLHPFHHLRAFWAAEVDGRISLYIERLNFLPAIHVVVPDTRVEEVLLFLGEYLPWHDHRSESSTDRLGRWLKI